MSEVDKESSFACIMKNNASIYQNLPIFDTVPGAINHMEYSNESDSCSSKSDSEVEEDASGTLTNDTQRENYNVEAMSRKLFAFTECKCKHTNAKCIRGINVETILKCYTAFNGCTHVPQVLKRNNIGGLLTASIGQSDCNIESNKRHWGQNKRQVVQYTIFGSRICEPAFRHVFNVSTQVIKSILKDIKTKSNAIHISLFKGRIAKNPATV